MKYVRILSESFVAHTDTQFWLCHQNDIKQANKKDNPKVVEFIDNGTPIKDRIFEMNIPKKLTGEQHLAVAMYLGNLDNKERKI